MGKRDKDESGKKVSRSEQKRIDKDEEEINRLARGGRGGDNLSEALGDWRDEVRKDEK